MSILHFDAMKLASWPIIFLLVFALLVQNTCLHGFAGMTSFTGDHGHCPAMITTVAFPGGQKIPSSDLPSNCGHCPSMTSTVASPDGPKLLSSDRHIPVNFPMYVFTVPKTALAVHLQRQRPPQPTLVNGYKDALPDELLKPPRA